VGGRMDIREEIIENKGKIRMNELTVKALINVLSKGGVVVREDIEEELNRLISRGEE
jgi:hypothetical protein